MTNIMQKYSYLFFNVICNSIAVFLTIMVVSLIIFTPLKSYIPGYGDAAQLSELEKLQDKNKDLASENALLKELDCQEPLGILNVSFYRDDFSRSGLHPQVRPSELPFDIEDQHLVLIDDVLMSGRTIRAALNELFDYGRPASVTLVCLLDLNARELPIRPDIVGATLSLEQNQRVKLTGPEPLAIQLQTLDHL